MSARRDFPALPPSQAAFLARRTTDVLSSNPGLAVLRDLLLSFGGHEVVLPAVESDADVLVDCGAFRLASEPPGFRLVPGRAGRCHDNAAAWVEGHPSCFLDTGYALSGDGLWRQHSWVVTPEGVILETTLARYAYFGMFLSPAQRGEDSETH